MDDCSTNYPVETNQISLRDFFAAQPLSDNELESVWLKISKVKPNAEHYSLAEIRYFHADCMIAERVKNL